MAFMHFGNFLEGMRLSAQDIADKEKAALNERYMNEQMATMQLGRDNTRLSMEDTRMRMDRLPEEWRQADETHNQQAYDRDLKLWAGDITGAFAAEDPAGGTGEIFKYGRDRLNEIRAKRGYSPMNLDVVPDIGEDGKQTGKWALTQDGVTRGRFANEGDAHIAGAEILGGTSGVLAARIRKSQERRSASGGGNKYKQSSRPETARKALEDMQNYLIKLSDMQADPVRYGITTQEQKEWLNNEVATVADMLPGLRSDYYTLLSESSTFNEGTGESRGDSVLKGRKKPPLSDASKPQPPTIAANSVPVGTTKIGRDQYQYKSVLSKDRKTQKWERVEAPTPVVPKADRSKSPGAVSSTGHPFTTPEN